MDISNATENRHSSEIAAHVQKHRQRNLEKPATDEQDKSATHKHIKKDTVEISERARLAQQSQGLLKEIEPGPQTDNLFASFNEMRLAQIEERKQFLAGEAEANGDDFLKKIVNGDYGSMKYDNESLKTILSDEQYAKLENMYEQQRVEWEQQFKFLNSGCNNPVSAEYFIYNALKGKVENALDIAMELGNMVFDSRAGTATFRLGNGAIRPDLNPDAKIITDPKEFEALAANREAGRDLAKYIAENYFDDPKEAQAFMDKINKYIENSELRDQGYVTWFAEMEPMKPNPPDAATLFAQKMGYDTSHAWDRDFWEKYQAYEVERNTKKPLQYSVLRDPTWEELKEKLCDPRYNHDFEENRAWYSDFLGKMSSVQNIINNAKLITDFSSNEKWNIVMNLLS